MKPLAERVMQGYAAGEFHIVPERWNATFEHWDEQHPGLEHLAAAVVGAPDSVFTCATDTVGRPRGPEDVPEVWRRRGAGPDGSHLVLVVALALRTFVGQADADLARFYPAQRS